jgi:hypothetical protein
MKGGGRIAGYGSGSSAVIFFLQDGIGTSNRTYS